MTPTNKQVGSLHSFTRLALVLLNLRFVEEAVHHVCRLLYFAERAEAASTGE